MAFVIHPDKTTATLLGTPEDTPVRLAAGEAMTRFVPLAPLIGPDLTADDRPTTFMRIALSGPLIESEEQPNIELLAGEPAGGAAAATIDPNKAVDANTAVKITDGAGVLVASAFFEPPYDDNVYLLKIAVTRPDIRLNLRITNTTESDRDVVWVVADNPAETQQPWLHATFGEAVPIDIAFDAHTGEVPTADPILISNRGTGRFSISNTTPPVAAPYTLSGLPVTVAPNPQNPIPLRLSFTAPATPQEFPATSVAFVTANKIDPGPFGTGHNNRFSFRARSRFPLPKFATAQAFSPRRGVPPDFEDAPFTISLFGSGLDVGDVSVRFGDVEAEIFARSSSGLKVAVPFMEPATVPITVTTSEGTITSVDMFKVSAHPEIFDLSPFVFGDHGKSPEGRDFTIIGTRFIEEPGDTVSAFASLDMAGQQSGSVSLETLATGATSILVRAGAAPDFFSFIGGQVRITVSRSDGGRAVLEARIEGL